MTGMFNGEPSPFGPPPNWKMADHPEVRIAEVGAVMHLTDHESDGNVYRMRHEGRGWWTFVVEDGVEYGYDPNESGPYSAWDIMTHTMLFRVSNPGVEPSWTTVRLSEVANSEMPDRAFKYQIERYLPAGTSSDDEVFEPVPHLVTGTIISPELGMARLGNQSYRVDCVCGEEHILGTRSMVQVLN